MRLFQVSVEVMETTAGFFVLIINIFLSIVIRFFLNITLVILVLFLLN
jgi:hypothetical protein